MKLTCIYVTLFYIGVHAENEQKKTSQRDVNDAESIDYSLARIPVYVIPNTPPGPDGKIPVAVFPNSYPSAYLSSNGVKDKPLKYGFYAPYKTPKVTPIHEPQNEGYVQQATEAPQAYPTQDFAIYPRPEYEPQASYKIPTPNGAYYKYEQTPKALLSKQQSLSNNNAYASLAPVYSHPNYATNTANAPVNYPPPKKYTTYDPENNVQIQYVIKYVPVPYTVTSSADQYQNAAPEPAYITSKPYYKETPKKSSQNIQPVASSTENYVEYSKYSEPYSTTEDPSQYSAYKTYVQPNYNKYYDKNAYTKKYTPTSYVLATIGKSAPTHYAATIRHDSSPEQESASVYTTKLAPVPLPVDKYTQEDFKNSAATQDTKSYSEVDYSQSSALYSVPSGIKYKSSLVAPVLPQFYNFEYGSPFQYQNSGYQKKDVSASISSGRTTASSTEKQS